jgi:hypothetical protein
LGYILGDFLQTHLVTLIWNKMFVGVFQKSLTDVAAIDQLQKKSFGVNRHQNGCHFLPLPTVHRAIFFTPPPLPSLRPRDQKGIFKIYTIPHQHKTYENNHDYKLMIFYVHMYIGACMSYSIKTSVHKPRRCSLVISSAFRTGDYELDSPPGCTV